MRARTKIATLLVAWLVLIPIGVIIPGSAADALAPPEETELTGLLGEREPVDIELGQRLSRGSSSRASQITASWAPTFALLEKPEFDIWPHERLNQVVNLDSFMRITDGFEDQHWCFCFLFWNLKIDAYPVGSIFDFRETGTGVRQNEACLGPGVPWFLGQDDSSSFPFCGREWDHSSDVTGEVEARARVLHIVFFNGVGPVPMKSRAGDAKMLDVGEVMSVGQTISLPVTEPSPGSDTDGFCSVWGISVLCWVGETAYDAAVEAILYAAPVLREVKRFFEGCADAAMDAAGGLVDILRELADAITSPIDFVNEKLEEFRTLIDAIKEDPRAFAVEVLGDLAMLDVLENEGVAVWLGKVTCMLAIEYFTGKAATTILAGARTWLRNRRDNPDGPDGPRLPCPFSSFPGHTMVLMYDGTEQRIDSIRPGDWVISHNLDTSVWEPQLVVDQWSHLDRGPPATATIADGSTVTATDDHLFWRANTTEWVELQHLQAGDQLASPSGLVEVAALDVGVAQNWTVWELTVTDNHNFAVLAGDTPVLVHNRSCGEGVDDNNGTPIPGTTRRIGDRPQMTNDTPPRIIIDPGPPQVTRKPRAPSDTNPNFDHTKTTTDPVTGETTYYRKDGSSVTYDANGFPIFDSEMDVYLNPSEVGSGSSSADFGSANDKIRESLNNDPGFLDDFPQDVQDFYNQPTTPNQSPPGYTWHHHQDTGRMQLVPRDTHGDFPHTGGGSIWGR